ncbi:SDR family NAD(P)-dependent oxidoreductase [candidate division KSB1 bacterium]|nr:SDR family NAD(P)-dependent oxidoreductase [candidate division KSB1 bacterium]
MTGYSASKHAVVGFSLTLRAEAKQYGIKVTALCPGVIQTPIHDGPSVSEYMKSEKNKKKSAGMKFPASEEPPRLFLDGSGNVTRVAVCRPYGLHPLLRLGRREDVQSYRRGFRGDLCYGGERGLLYSAHGHATQFS